MRRGGCGTQTSQVHTDIHTHTHTQFRVPWPTYGLLVCLAAFAVNFRVVSLRARFVFEYQSVTFTPILNTQIKWLEITYNIKNEVKLPVVLVIQIC